MTNWYTTALANLKRTRNPAQPQATGDPTLIGYTFQTVVGFPVGPALVPPLFADGVTINGSNVFTSASAAFTAADIGTAINGTNIPANTTIAGFTNATTVTLSANATADGSGLSFILGRITLASNHQFNPIDASTLPLVVHLYAAAFHNDVLVVQKVDGTGHTVTVVGATGDTVNGGAAVVLAAQGNTGWFWSNNVHNWYLAAKV